MTAILGGWNPAKWTWHGLEHLRAATARGQTVPLDWGVSRPRHGHQRDLRGRALDGTPGRTIRYVDVVLDRVLDPVDVLPVELLQELCPRTNWSPQSSGTSVHPADEERVEQLWQEHLARL